MGARSTGRPTRREFVKAAGAGGGLALAGPSALTLATPAIAADATIKVGFLSPLTGPLAGFGETDPYILSQARKALTSGVTIGGKKYGVEIIDKDTQSDPVRAGQLAKELIERDKVDMMLSTSTPEVVNPVADACEAAGVPSLSTVMPWEAFYFGRGAKPGQPSPFKWSLSLQLRRRRFSSLLRLAVERAGQDQQEGRRSLSQRRRRQRDSRASRPGAGQGRLHDCRSGRLRGRHDRLLVADRQVQGRELRDLQHLPDSARLRHLLAAGRAAGVHQDGQDRADRQDRPLPFPGRGARVARAGPRQRRLLAQGLPLQLAAHRLGLATKSPKATRRRPASNGRSSSARRCRCSTPASRRSRRAAIRPTRRASRRR